MGQYSCSFFTVFRVFRVFLNYPLVIFEIHRKNGHIPIAQWRCAHVSGEFRLSQIVRGIDRSRLGKRGAQAKVTRFFSYFQAYQEADMALFHEEKNVLKPVYDCERDRFYEPSAKLSVGNAISAVVSLE